MVLGNFPTDLHKPGSEPAMLAAFRQIAREIDVPATQQDVKDCVEGTVKVLQASRQMFRFLEGLGSVGHLAKPGAKGIYALKCLPSVYWKHLTSLKEWHAAFTASFRPAADSELAEDLLAGVDAIGVEPQEVVFVSAKHFAVFSAQALGMTGVLADSEQIVVQRLTTLLGRPALERAWGFLESKAREIVSTTAGQEGVPGSQYPVPDIFSSVLIRDLGSRFGDLGSMSVDLIKPIFKFFKDSVLVDALAETTGDTSTTCLAHLTLDIPEKLSIEALRTIESEIGQIGPRWTNLLASSSRQNAGFNLVSYALILRLFYHFGRKYDGILNAVEAIVEHRAYRLTVGDNQPELFLYFLSRLVDENPELSNLKNALLKAVEAETEQSKDHFGLSLIAIALQLLGLDCGHIINKLKSTQHADGGWDACVYAVHGPSNVRIESRVVTTAFATKAIEGAKRIARKPKKSFKKAEGWEIGKSMVKLLKQKTPAKIKDVVTPIVIEPLEAISADPPMVQDYNPFILALKYIRDSSLGKLLAMDMLVTFGITAWIGIAKHGEEWDVGMVNFGFVASLGLFVFTVFALIRDGEPRTLGARIFRRGRRGLRSSLLEGAEFVTKITRVRQTSSQELRTQEAGRYTAKAASNWVRGAVQAVGIKTYAILTRGAAVVIERNEELSSPESSPILSPNAHEFDLDLAWPRPNLFPSENDPQSPTPHGQPIQNWGLPWQKASHSVNRRQFL